MKGLQKQANPVPTGATGVVIQVGQIFNEEPNEEVRGWKWYGDMTKPGIADEMVRTDAQVRQSMQTLVDPITNAIWDASPAETKTPAEEEHARFVSYNLFRWRLSFDRFLRQATTGCVKHGVSLFEPTTDIVDVPASLFPNHPSPVVNGVKKVLFITGLERRLPRTIWKWHADKQHPSRLEALEQWIQPDDTNKVSGTRMLPTIRANGSPGLLRFTFDEDGNNFEGLAKLRSIWFPWKVKRLLRMLEGIRHERQNLGLPTITLPANATNDDKAYVKKILEQLRGHERVYLVLPNGFQFEFNTSGQGNGTNIQAAIESCDRDIWMNVGAPFMTFSGGSGHGSFALAETMNEVRILGLRVIAKILQEPFNVGVDAPPLIPWLVQANYGMNVLQFPSLGPTNMPTQDWAKVIPETTKAVTARIIQVDDPLESFYRRVMGLPNADPSTRRALPVQTSGFGASSGTPSPDGASSAPPPTQEAA